MTKKTGNLFISKLELNVHLGWTEEERARTQKILADIEIRFANVPAACNTDQLQDALCYDALIRRVREKIKEKHFHLIEHLSDSIYQTVRAQLSENMFANVRVHKFPNIDGLTDGVYFSVGDIE